MPIKRNRPMPLPKAPKKEQPYRLPGPPLEALKKELRIKASDADWVGDHEQAMRYDAEADAIQARIDAGELYEIEF